MFLELSYCQNLQYLLCASVWNIVKIFVNLKDNCWLNSSALSVLLQMVIKHAFVLFLFCKYLTFWRFPKYLGRAFASTVACKIHLVLRAFV